MKLTTKYSHDKLDLIHIILTERGENMESAEKNILIEKVKHLPPEQVEKVLIFIAGLEAGNHIRDKQGSEKNKIG